MFLKGVAALPPLPIGNSLRLRFTLGTPIGLCEFGIFLGKDETIEGLVLGLGFELRFVGGAGGGIR